MNLQAPNEHTERLVAILKHIMEDNSIKLGGQVKLENYMSPNFMGLFVEDEHIEDFNRITMKFVDQVSNFGKDNYFFSIFSPLCDVAWSKDSISHSQTPQISAFAFILPRKNDRSSFFNHRSD